jgi:hypothetical protein
VEISEEKIDKIVEAVHNIREDLVEQKITLAKQAVVLEDHTRRSFAAEENLALLRQQIRPIESHVLFVRGVVKTIVVLISLVSAAAAVIKLFH